LAKLFNLLVGDSYSTALSPFKPRTGRTMYAPGPGLFWSWIILVLDYSGPGLFWQLNLSDSSFSCLSYNPSSLACLFST